MIDEEIEKDYDNFEAELEKKRHDDIMGIMGKVLLAIKESNKLEIAEKKDDTELKELVGKNKELIDGFLSKIKELQQPKQTDVKVEVNQDKVINALNEFMKNIDGRLQALEQKENVEVKQEKKQYIVEIKERNFKGMADKILIKEV